jgi:hypothetical protein
MSRPYPPPIPPSLIRLELSRIGLPEDQAPGCDICDTPSTWAIRTDYQGEARRMTMLTNLCEPDSSGFLAALTDRIGARDA